VQSVPEVFGSMVFNDVVMKERLPKEIYKSLKKTIEEGSDLDLTVANAVANAMKDWAIEKGVTHFSHWFQPMTGITAEKHDSFISPQGDGRVIMEFSGKELIRGEPDASSFPSGGLRATFEARGYTAWDPTSYAFIKENTLCIPTAFCSYTGDVLDKKTPLLRSMNILSREALRILRLLGDTKTSRVISTVGPEQEYFLIDKELYNRRKDLIFTGRTLFGARPPKGQELEDHYFGAIKPRVLAFMRDLNEQLWKLGVFAKTEHNEVAPAQHEIAPIFTTANIATDHNQLTMELLKKVADKHGLACLLHEKPFAGVNGSGKHNNWSICTNTGQNLFDPGKNPHENKLFLLLLCAVIKAVDTHQDLLRISAASAGNDHRLGANEAPPAIVSIFLGSELTSILECIEEGKPYNCADGCKMETGVNVLPDFIKDTTDRNRTSPFAFTGNKFEFRMLGSSFSIAGPNIVLNTMFADALKEFADRLEAASDFESELAALMRETIKKHKRIIFNGNNYAKEWVEEAEKRGLLNLRTTVDALPLFKSEKNIDLFSRHKVLSKSEIIARYEIIMESYWKTLNIEAHTMSEMVKKDILPAVLAYTKELSETLATKKAIGVDITEDATFELVNTLTKLTNSLHTRVKALDDSIAAACAKSELLERAAYFRDTVAVCMSELRAVVDELETLVAAKYWPLPTYGDLLFRI
jgi:glutamine synthetase